MSKKSFKDNPALAFIGNTKTAETVPAPEIRPNNATPPPAESNPNQKYYRINLKLKAEYKDYLEQASWDSRKSITQYINDLIAADKECHPQA